MNLNIEIGKKALISCDNWFIAPDGCEYKAVFGTIKSVRTSEETLGVKTNAKSTNWYVEIGNMTVAGCQIHYAICTDTCNTGGAQGWSIDPRKDGAYTYERPSLVYFAD